MTQPFPRLFSSIRIGSRSAKNRIAVTAHNLNWDDNGRLNQEYVDYLIRRAKGGAGIVMCFGAANVDAAAGSIPGRVSLWDPDNEPLLTELAEGIKAHGALAISQVNHVGRRGTSASTERPLLAPSEDPEPTHRETPHELESEEIARIIESFADAAQRLARCGWDGVEVTSFGGQLIEQFWSPTINTRSDHYGQSFEGRMRFGVEVVRAVRDALPQDAVVAFRMTGDALADELGLTRPDLLRIAEHLDSLDMIDVFNISGGTGATLKSQAAVVPPATFAPGCYLPLARDMKERLRVPVLSAGRILDPSQAEGALRDGDCDLVAMTRATIADPDLPKLARAGQTERIRPCISINDACIGRSYQGRRVLCAVNAAVGHPALAAAEEDGGANQRRVLVVGGGPAGLEAARVASLRGHAVTLLEAADRLGGQVAVAALAEDRPRLGEHVAWLTRQIKRQGVEVRLDTTVDSESLQSLQPDQVIIATGASSVVPDLCDPAGVVVSTDVQVLRGEVPVEPGSRVVVYDREGGIRGGSISLTVARKGAHVTLATPLQAPSQDLDPTQLPFIRTQQELLGVEILTEVRLLGLDRQRATFSNVWSDAETTLSADHVVFVGFYRANSDLARRLRHLTSVGQVQSIGDCVAPRTLRDAVREGAMAGAMV
jgi:2,4-dienoyl-CoA reductase-like NADH-dependent reductase (Old Yellow Enzyme family)/thioredoxin reductase